MHKTDIFIYKLQQFLNSMIYFCHCNLIREKVTTMNSNINSVKFKTMKTLDLSVYGVQEMNVSEMKTLEGSLTV
jgi:hypothetical protein